MKITKMKIKNKNKYLVKKNKHNFYSDDVKKLMSESSHMLCGSHFCAFPPSLSWYNGHRPNGYDSIGHNV
jgi:hypothetical protein